MTAIYPLAVRGLTWPIMKSHEFSTLTPTAANFVRTAIGNSQNPRWHFTLVYDYLKDNPGELVASLSPHTDYRYFEGFLLSLQGQYGDCLLDDLTDDTFGMRSVAGGPSGSPSSFKLNTLYPLGSYIVDNNATPHLQQVIQGGKSGSTVPAFSTSGGNTTTGGVIVTDTGVFPGASAQVVPLVTDGTFWYSPVQRNFGGQFLEDITDLNQTVYALKAWDNGTLKALTTDYTIQNGGISGPGWSYQGAYLKWVGTPTGPITILGAFYFRLCLESDQIDIENFLRQMWTIGGSEGKNGSGFIKLQTSRLALI